LPIFAAEKKRKGLSMTTILIIIAVLALVFACIPKGSGMPKRTNMPPPKKRRSPDPPGWGTPHGF